MQNTSVASAGVFNPVKNDKIVFYSMVLTDFWNFAHESCLVPVWIATDEEESALKVSFSPTVLPFPLNFSQKSQN